jgi:lipopolysaccharide transport system permease protein
MSSAISNPYRARFDSAQARANGPGRVSLEGTIENTSGVTWTSRNAGGVDSSNGSHEIGPVTLGYNVFDAQTGLLVMEGEHLALDGDCAPGASTQLTADIQLPPEAGHYRVWVSPVHENVAWFCDQGSDFLEVEVASTDGVVAVTQTRATNNASLRWRRATEMLKRGLLYPWRTAARHRSLILSMVRRDILGRYRGSMAGALWTLIHPMLLMIAYYFVFAIVLRVRFAPGQGRGGFLFYFLCGMLPWLAISEAVGRAPGVVLEHSGFVKRVVFPLEILPLNLTTMGLATEVFALAIFIPALAIGPGIHSSAGYLPLILIPQLLFTAGLCWFLSALGVFLRDTGQVMGFLLTIWFFVTPICYPSSQLPESSLWLFRLNPVYTIVGAYRAVLLEGAAPQWPPLLKLWGLSLLLFWAGYAWFFKAKKSFADLI